MRLDFLVSQRLNVSRTKAQGIVKNGDVSVDGRIIN
ncbi:MAG: TlyA family RNA methyltransferase, partial [Clostridia bacterium]|nr:TlyA family RNA methyltransferase [Clostridia bacterium]